MAVTTSMFVVLNILNPILRNSTLLFCIINYTFIFVAYYLHGVYLMIFHSLTLNLPIQVLGFIVWYFVVLGSRRPSVSVCGFI